MSEVRPVVLVTGAAQGIGRVTAIEFARRGYDVSLVSLPGDDIESAAQEVRAQGAQAAVFGGDLVDLDFAQRSVEQTVQQLGRIDVLINNAVWREIATMRTISLESWERTLRIGLTTPAFMARWAAADMEKRRKGVIINISSVMSQFAAGYSPSYMAIKGALDSLTYELAVLYGPVGIRVVALRPGSIASPGSYDYKSADGNDLTRRVEDYFLDVVPLRRMGTALEMATTMAFLASDDAGYISGTTITADGGVQRHLGNYTLARMQFPEQFS